MLSTPYHEVKRTCKVRPIVYPGVKVTGKIRRGGKRRNLESVIHKRLVWGRGYRSTSLRLTTAATKQWERRSIISIRSLIWVLHCQQSLLLRAMLRAAWRALHRRALTRKKTKCVRSVADTDSICKGKRTMYSGILGRSSQREWGSGEAKPAEVERAFCQFPSGVARIGYDGQERN